MPVAAAVRLTAYARYTGSGIICELLWLVMVVPEFSRWSTWHPFSCGSASSAPHARAMLNFYGHKNSSIYVALPSVGHRWCWTSSLGIDVRVRSALLYIVAVLQCLISYSAASAAALFVLAAFMVVVRFPGRASLRERAERLGVCGILSLFIMVWPVQGALLCL